LERVHVSSHVWLDGKEIGTGNSLSTPHVFPLGQLTPGRHVLMIAVDNNTIPNIGENSHCVSDHMQTAWNGIVGKIAIEATPNVWLDCIETYPDLPGKRVTVKWHLGGAQPVAGKIGLVVRAPDGKEFQASANADAGQAVVELGSNIHTWDEFSPQLYRVTAILTSPDGATHQVSSTFGMVEYKVEGRHFLVNGRRTVFRGTLDCAMFPLTGYPSTDVAYWKKVIAVVKKHGLNHIRFHSWCPPEAAFIAADEMGCYLNVEHAWTDPAAAGKYLMAEAERVVRAYGNHPSFTMHTYGNEPGGGNAWMENFAAHFIKRDPRRFYAGSTGWPMLKNNQYHSLMDGLRVYPWGAGLGSSINAQTPNTMDDFRAKTQSDSRPMLAHETGQWCVYPDFDEISKYTGFLKAKNFEIFRDFLANNHMADQARDFLMASGRLQTLCYKYEIEKLLRTPDIGGYQLLGLNDFPGQGTALVGAVNPFWETKPYTTPAEYVRFSGPSVLLARLPKFVFKADETLSAKLEISHYAAKPLTQVVPAWKIVAANGRTLAEGKLTVRDIPIGQSVLGEIQVPLAAIPTPSQVKLVVGIADTPIENDWDLWVYPAPAPKPATDGIVITSNIQEAMAKAQAGESVLLTVERSEIVTPEGPKIVFGFSTIFWNTAWSSGQPPTTLGILCNPKHPAFAQFPTEYHSNYQWWYLTRLTPRLLSLQGQEPKFRPLVQVIDDWFTARRLGLLIEANYGKGKLMISAINFNKAKPDDLVASQFLASLLVYMKSPDFAPKDTLDDEHLAKIIKTTKENKLITKVEASSANAAYPASNAIDDDPDTLWHSEWHNPAQKFPHELKLTLTKPMKLSGLSLLPRQDGGPGWMKDIEILVSTNNTDWTSVAKVALAKGSDWQEIPFPPVEAGFVKLRILSPQQANQHFASLAEIVPVVAP
jgi:hypothetical protein